jgi:peptidyl-prolyl cis-trans isomerase C
MKFHRNLLISLICVLALSFVFGGCRESAEEAKVKPADNASVATKASLDENVLVTVDNKKVTVSEYIENYRKVTMKPFSKPGSQKTEQEKVQDYVDDILLYKEANILNLEEDPEIKKALENTRKSLMVRALMNKIKKKAPEITDEAISAHYEEHKDQFMTQEKIRASQIALKTKEEAEEILKQLKKGADFAELAKEKSITLDNAKGGDMGFFARGQVPPAFKDFQEAAFALKNPGDLSDIVQTRYGYHVIKLTARKPARLRELNEASEEIRAYLTRDAHRGSIDAYLESLRDKVDIEVNEKALVKLQEEADKKSAREKRPRPLPPPSRRK